MMLKVSLPSFWGGAEMRRRVWSVDELSAILRAVALAGGDARTLAVLATALGLPVGQGEGERTDERFATVREKSYNMSR